MLCVTNPRSYFRHDGASYGPAQVIDLPDTRAKQLATEGQVQTLKAKKDGPAAREEAGKKFYSAASKLFRAEFGVKSDQKLRPENVVGVYGEVPLLPGQETAEDEA